MKLLCPTCGSPQSRPVGNGSKRECSACYTQYEVKKPKGRKADTTPDIEPEKQED